MYSEEPKYALIVMGVAILLCLAYMFMMYARYHKKHARKKDPEMDHDDDEWIIEDFCMETLLNFIVYTPLPIVFMSIEPYGDCGVHVNYAFGTHVLTFMTAGFMAYVFTRILFKRLNKKR